ncbi:hypothetical protein V1478_018131 [Vespula squamosa]|uniref:Uncharacterized protein n=1 Tax=Vespula squamosa TaxID=30214 RepID=A0ABD1ZW63_VESSQ
MAIRDTNCQLKIFKSDKAFIQDTYGRIHTNFVKLFDTFEQVACLCPSMYIVDLVSGCLGDAPLSPPFDSNIHVV